MRGTAAYKRGVTATETTLQRARPTTEAIADLWGPLAGIERGAVLLIVEKAVRALLDDGVLVDADQAVAFAA